MRFNFRIVVQVLTQVVRNSSQNKVGDRMCNSKNLFNNLGSFGFCSPESLKMIRNNKHPHHTGLD
jgi:hypothetical protein